MTSCINNTPYCYKHLRVLSRRRENPSADIFFNSVFCLYCNVRLTESLTFDPNIHIKGHVVVTQVKINQSVKADGTAGLRWCSTCETKQQAREMEKNEITVPKEAREREDRGDCK